MPRTAIAALGSCVPDRVVTNDDLTRLMDTSDEWIQQRTGIRERRWVAEGQGNSDMALAATRLVAAVIEASHDDTGIIWPEPVAPFKVAILNLKQGASNTDAACEQLYRDLTAREIEVHCHARRRSRKNMTPRRTLSRGLMKYPRLVSTMNPEPTAQM